MYPLEMEVAEVLAVLINLDLMQMEIATIELESMEP